MDNEGAYSEVARLRAVVARTGWCAAAFVVALLAVAASIACSSSPGTSDATPDSRVSPTPTSRTGQETFTSTCAACHGDTGQGQPNWHIPKEDGTLPAPPLNGEGHTWHHPDGFLYRVVSQGGRIQEGPGVPDFKSGMPAFGDNLSHEEIIEVLTYVKSLWSGKTSRSGLSISESQAFVSEGDPFPASGGG